MSGVRSTAKWQRVCAEVLDGATHCAICRGLLDFDAPSRSKWAPSVDHIRPLARGGDPFDRANLQPSHFGCNRRKAASTPPPRPKPESVVSTPTRMAGVLVCGGHACPCEWLGNASPEDCSHFATRQTQWVSVPDRSVA